MVLWKETKVLYLKLCNFDFTVEKLWYYGKNYKTVPKTMVLW